MRSVFLALLVAVSAVSAVPTNTKGRCVSSSGSGVNSNTSVDNGTATNSLTTTAPNPTTTTVPNNNTTSTNTTDTNTTTGTNFERKTPNTVVLDAKYMVDAVSKVADGDFKTELDALLSQADAFLTQGPWTVTNKTKDVPDGTKNDYASQAPYWWPVETNNGTCKYEQRDGCRNPEVDQYTDRRDGANMMTSAYLLALAWWYTDKPEYRIKAASVLETWFINEETRMTPHLEHAQIVPCKNTGRAIGIIDFSQQYTDVIDAVGLLNTVSDSAWDEKRADAYKEWNTEFLKWLTDSDFGKEELAEENNHGSFAAMQIAAISSWLGDKTTSTKYLKEQFTRIDNSIASNGSQPLELERQTSFHYSTFSLVAYLRMVALGRLKDVDVDLWGYTGSEGQSIPNAVKYLIPYAAGEATWPWPEKHFDRYAAYDIVNFAADLGMDEAKQAIDKLEAPPAGGTWALAPAVQQLDSILNAPAAPSNSSTCGK